MNLQRFGTEYGGFYYPSDLHGLNDDSVIYCVGAGEDISHDICVAKKLGCHVYIFDPTPRSIRHVDYVKDVMDGKKEAYNDPRFGGGDIYYWDIIKKNRISPDRVIFTSCGLYTEEGTFKFYEPQNKNYVSHSLVEGMTSEEYIDVKTKTLNQFMKENGHEHIDLLKIDIEGVECQIIFKMINDKIFPKYLSVDLDIARIDGKMKNTKLFNETLELLVENDYDVIHSEKFDYTFMRKELGK
jgi:hypothetical protein